MGTIINSILFKNNDKRTNKINEQIFFSIILRSVTIIINFIIVPLTVNYLGIINYGIWLVITSVISWFNFFDVGLGHGLRNKFAELKTLNKIEELKIYISSTYFFTFLIVLTLTIFFILISPLINWSLIFNIDSNANINIENLVVIVFIGFFFQLLLKLITNIYIADQYSSINSTLNFLYQTIYLLSLYYLIKIRYSSLLIYGLIFTLTPIVILFLLNVISFKNKYKEVRPNFNYIRKNKIKNIFKIGFKFFLIQLSAVILYSTDNLIISQLYSPKEVVPYSIIFKYFSIINISFSIIVTPYWSAITEAYTKNEFYWIKKSIKKLISIGFIFSIITIFMIILSPNIFSIWINNEIVIPIELTFYIGIFTIISVFILPFVYFINGTGKINLQLYIGLLMALINIPLSIYFSKYIFYGVDGVIFATIICSLIGLIIYPIQYSKIINRNDDGIWG